MKSSLKIITSVCILVLSIAACNTGKSLYEKGNYYQAVIRSVEKLKKSPNNKKAQETLSNAYPNAIDYYLDQLDNQKSSPTEFMNTEIVYIYDKLNSMYESIQLSPVAKEVINDPKKYYADLEKIKPFAAKEQYNAGVKNLNYGDRVNAKKAYYHFLEADNFVKNYKDVQIKTDEAYDLSLLHVVAHLEPVQSRYYKLSATVFYSQVEHILDQLEQKEFIVFHTPEEAKNTNLRDPDQILRINFEDFIVGETHTKERVEKMESDSIKIGEVKINDRTTKDVYGTVKAVVNVNRMEVISKGFINLTIEQNGNSKEVLVSEDIAGQHIWFNEWGNYNGDERALTKEQIHICNQKNINPIPPQQMFVEFTKPISEQLKTRLFNYYRNY